MNEWMNMKGWWYNLLAMLMLKLWFYRIMNEWMWKSDDTVYWGC